MIVRLKTVIVLIAVLLLSTAGLWAQNRAALTVTCDKIGAQVYLNGRLVGTTTPNFSQLVATGTYKIEVKLRNYPDFSTTVTVGSAPVIVDVKFDAPAKPATPQPVTPQPITPQPITPLPVTPQSLGPAQTLGSTQTTQPAPTISPITSADSYSFQLVPLPNSSLLRAIVRGPDKFVLSGNNGIIFTSEDGLTWVRRDNAPIVNTLDIIYASDQYVAVGDWGSIATSKDGISWTKQQSPVNSHLIRVAWNGSRYVISGQVGVILTSEDGKSWKKVNTGLSSHVIGLVYGDGQFVAVTLDGNVLTSIDGLSWQKASLQISPLQAQSIVYGPKGFVIGTTGKNATLLHSLDAKTWTKTYQATGEASFAHFLWDNDRYLVSNDAALMESLDGKIWTAVNSGTTKKLNRMASGNGATVINIGDGSGLLVSRTPGKEAVVTLTARANAIPVTFHWHAADTADIYINGQAIASFQPEFKKRRDEAPEPALSASGYLADGDIITVGTRRGGSFGFMLIAVDSAGKIVWHTSEGSWFAYDEPTDSSLWYDPVKAWAGVKRPVSVNQTPWHQQVQLNKRFNDIAQSVYDAPSKSYAFLISKFNAKAGGLLSGLSPAAQPAVAVPATPSVAASATVPATPSVAASAAVFVDLPLGTTGDWLEFMIGDPGTADEFRYFKFVVPDSRNHRVALLDPSTRGSYYLYLYTDAAMQQEIGDGKRVGRLDHPLGDMYYRDLTTPGTYYLKIQSRRQAGLLKVEAYFSQYDRIYDSERN